MALCWVKVVRADGDGFGDEVFIDGNIGPDEAAGLVGIAFVTETGQHDFETLDSNLDTTWFADDVTVVKRPGNGEDNPYLVTLIPV
ncbi:MAG TPA: hypothetical protein VF274_13100 [Alphaproteobacteria bacterium]